MGEKQKKVMGIDGLAHYLDVSKSTLYKLAQEGKLPGQKVGKHWRFRKETVDKWLDEGAAMTGVENNDNVNKKHSTDSIESTKLFTTAQIKSLNDYWLNSIGQVIAVASTPEGNKGLCRLLGISNQELQELIAKTMEQIDPKEIERLRSTEPGGELGLRLSEEEDNSK